MKYWHVHDNQPVLVKIAEKGLRSKEISKKLKNPTNENSHTCQ